MQTRPDNFISANETLRREIRAMVRGAYDLQDNRTRIGLRVVANFKSKLGQAPGTKEEDLEKVAGKLLKQLRQDYDRITDAIAGKRIYATKFSKYCEAPENGESLISNFAEYSLAKMYFEILKSEEEAFSHLSKVVEEHPLWVNFLEGVKGCGPAMASVIISEIDISKARYPSSLVMYAGIDVAPDGRGRSRQKDHLVDVTYTDKNGKEATKKSITYNPFLKHKMLGVMCGCILKTGKDNRYSKVYYDYRHRLENHIKYKDVSAAHRHAMSMRYMLRIFLYDLYNAWRPLEGLEVANTYQESKLGHTHRPY